MSNGQLAHHLKVLEDQELLWRRRDGRMMRYYPATVDQMLDEKYQFHFLLQIQIHYKGEF